ncbi:MAG TPA: hypothetical protein VJO32_15130, partial [Ktedonobacteraceae bacterium]|nr:hypothetical protein [Ktedonobacteraceae bacterium]
MFDDFATTLDSRWTQTCVGGGLLHIEDAGLRMSFDAAQQGQYTDAQIDDYGRLPRSKFPWTPPVRMEVRARSSLLAATLANTTEQANTLRGTAGFG